ncbi:MAG: hypothetical protein PHQ23_05790, partial [Candidatus Wallbacteria bacterium]|nr:hypothetical protein [Candidatus Wallbacteria bacterium]
MDYIVEWKNPEEFRTGRLKGAGLKPGFGRIDDHLAVFYNIPKVDVLNNAMILLKSSRIENQVKEFILDEIKKTERRLTTRFPVSGVFLEINEGVYELRELSYNGFRLADDADITSAEGELYFREDDFRCQVTVRRIHHADCASGYIIEAVSSGYDLLENFLRRKSVARPD